MGGIEVRKENAVCFTGHREIREPISEVEQRLTETVESLIRQGYIFSGQVVPVDLILSHLKWS